MRSLRLTGCASFLARTVFWCRSGPQSSQLPKPGTIRFWKVSNARCYSQFNFGAGSGPAPDIQVGANFLCALSHSRQSKVSRPMSFLENDRIDSHAVVSDSNAELAPLIVELGFN